MTKLKPSAGDKINVTLKLNFYINFGGVENTVWKDDNAGCRAEAILFPLMRRNWALKALSYAGGGVLVKFWKKGTILCIPGCF